MLSLRFVVVILTCLAAALGLPRHARGNDGDDTLQYYLSRSDVVVLGAFTSELDAFSDEAGVINYVGDFKIAQLLKGKPVGERRVGGTIKVCVIRFERAAADRLPELKKGGKCILFLKYQERLSPAYITADMWFGVQRPSPSMAESLARLAAKQQGGKKGAKLTPKELEAHWEALAGNDAAKAYKAVWALAADPERSVPFLNKRLKPVPSPDQGQVDKLLTALDSDRFSEREKAMAQLEKMGELALDPITKALQEKPPLEKRRRLEMLRDRLSSFTLSGEPLRTWRALEVLELIGNEPARQVLQRLAKGAPGVWQTKQAQMALEQLSGISPLRDCDIRKVNANEQTAEFLAEELEKLYLSKQSSKASERTRELLAQDRPLAAQVLSLLLENKRIEGRSHIIGAIHDAKLKEAVPALVRLVNDPDEGVRSWSITTLGGLGDKSVVPALEKRLPTEPKRRIRHNIRVSLAQLGRPHLKYFIDGLSDRNPDRRYLCLTALEKLKDPRAVPHLYKLLESKDTWEPWHTEETLTAITGVPNTIPIEIVVKSDGVSQRLTRRPREEFKKDCDTWLAEHRRAVNRPLEKPVESWHFTPEPFLPGLNVSFAMNVQQVIQVQKKAFLDYQHQPEKRWSEKGTSFYNPEVVSATQSCLAALNQGLVRIRYIFEGGRLSAIAITRTGRGGSVIEPLKKPLQLRSQGFGQWIGLGGAIVVGCESGDAEKETYVISLNFARE